MNFQSQWDDVFYQVQRNHARAGFLYLDDKLDWFMDHHGAAAYEMTHNQMGPHIGDRLAVSRGRGKYAHVSVTK